MTYRQYMNAHESLGRLMNLSLNIKDAYAVFRMNKAFDSVIEFGVQREKALVEKYNGVIQEDGSIRFIDGDSDESKAAGAANMSGFIKEYEALMDTEVGDEVNVITLRCNDIDGAKITPVDMIALDGFVCFE